MSNLQAVPADLPMTCRIGDTFLPEAIVLVEDNESTLVDITGASAEFVLYLPNGTTPLLELESGVSNPDGSLTIDDEASSIQIEINAEFTAERQACPHKYFLRLTYQSGQVQTILASKLTFYE